MEKSPYVNRGSTKFGMMTHFDLLIVVTVKNLKFYKSKMAAAAILNNRKIAISQVFELITVNYKSNTLTTRLSSHKLPHQYVTCLF